MVFRRKGCLDAQPTATQEAGAKGLDISMVEVHGTGVISLRCLGVDI